MPSEPAGLTGSGSPRGSNGACITCTTVAQCAHSPPTPGAHPNIRATPSSSLHRIEMRCVLRAWTGRGAPSRLDTNKRHQANSQRQFTTRVPTHQSLIELHQPRLPVVVDDEHGLDLHMNTNARVWVPWGCGGGERRQGERVGKGTREPAQPFPDPTMAAIWEVVCHSCAFALRSSYLECTAFTPVAVGWRMRLPRCWTWWRPWRSLPRTVRVPRSSCPPTETHAACS